MASPTRRHVIGESVVSHQPFDVRILKILRHPEAHLVRRPGWQYDPRAVGCPLHIVETILVADDTQVIACTPDELVRGENSQAKAQLDVYEP